VPDHATPCPCSPDPAATTGPRQIGLGVLTEYVPAQLIDEVLADTGRLERFSMPGSFRPTCGPAENC